jgi:hypothetical protein
MFIYYHRNWTRIIIELRGWRGIPDTASENDSLQNGKNPRRMMGRPGRMIDWVIVQTTVEYISTSSRQLIRPLHPDSSSPWRPAMRQSPLSEGLERMTLVASAGLVEVVQHFVDPVNLPPASFPGH